MSLGLHDYERRRRRRAFGRFVRFAFYLGLIGVAAVFAYQTGIEQMEGRRARLAEEIETLSAAIDDLERERMALQTAAGDAASRYRELAARFEREVPRGVRRELAEMVSQRLEEGVEPERLAFYIREAGPPTDCTEPVTRSFFMPTPVWNGANTSARFAGGRIVVSGLGENTRAPDGTILGPFDPEEDVMISFTEIGGEQSQITGRLPLYHSMVMGDSEYRFAITEGPSSMVTVTADRCAYP
jgi:hypothetical protein